MRRTQRARLRSSQAIARAEAARARSDARDWAAERRARTRHLIELGGLIHKAGLVDLLEDDRATLLGLLLQAAGQLRGGGDEPPEVPRARWRHAGLRAFQAEREAAEGDAGEAGIP
ncbi:conjugal transfer protein TraD [Roseomonas ludipueritiae]|uniref:Conjugal transfer protein TraD n=1 Tax=Pseudoroseomonas ludipueritiae TaxID=198093 RepID=A0ABR7RBI5_9PROT|nr:conjugal transfer protein TraD [Pseudoroseomonas ludipueritiae]